MKESLQSSPVVRVDVSAVLPDGQTVAPTNDAVYFAFLAPIGPSAEGGTDTVPTSGTTWSPATWDTTGAGFTAMLQILGTTGIGPSVAGDYMVWVKIVDGAATYIKAAGPLTLY